MGFLMVGIEMLTWYCLIHSLYPVLGMGGVNRGSGVVGVVECGVGEGGGGWISEFLMVGIEMLTLYCLIHSIYPVLRGVG